MAGSHHNAAANTEVSGRKINLLGTAQTDVLHRDTLQTESLNQRPLDRFAGQANVMSHHHGTGLNDLGVCLTNAVGNLFIQLVWNAPTDIVGLKTIEGDSHASRP